MTRLSRILFGILVLSLLLPVAIFATGGPEAEEKTQATAGGKEAPMLAALVNEGKLPPLEERLPTEPLVVKPYGEIGRYGGELNMFRPQTWQAREVADMSDDALLGWNLEGSELLPNVAKAYEISDDGRSFTFFLREGHKWSDGAPFTADDIEFWWVDLMRNEELTPRLSSTWKAGKEPAIFEKLDETTVRFTFKDPQGFFVEFMAGEFGEIWRPKHVLQKYHPRYASQADIDKVLKEEGFGTWVELMSFKMDAWKNANPDVPTLRGWVLKTEPPASRFVAERNPYYYKVDTEGNQLPYIDRVITNPDSNQEVVDLNIVQGNADLAYINTTFSNFTLYKENEASGGYRTLLWANDASSELGLEINQTHTEDPVLGEILRDKRFRQALSMGIDRNQLNELLYSGQGKPRAATLLPESPYYKPEWEMAYANHDLDAANGLLDQMGLEWDKDHQWRLRPDGKPVSLLIETTAVFAGAEDTFAIIKQDWRDIGVQLDWDVTSDRSHFRNRIYSGKTQIAAWHVNGAIYPYKFARWAPWRTNCYWASLNGLWYASGGEQGIKPVGDVMKLTELYDEIQVTTDTARKKEIMQGMFDLHAENVWIIGLVGGLPMPIIVNEKLRNVPEESFFAWLIGRYIAHKHPYQFYYAE